MRTVKDLYEIRVRWLPFLLRPNMPPDGVEKPAHTPGNPRVNPHLKKAGETVGIDFTGKCPRYPNTLAAHALIEYAAQSAGEQKQNQLVEAIFQAYFTDGIYPDANNLAVISETCGFDKSDTMRIMQDDSKLRAAYEAAVDWSRKGVSGVPMFYMNGQKMVSGAQEPDALAKLIEIAAQRFPISA